MLFATNAHAGRIPDALYDQDGNLISMDFAPEDVGPTTAGMKRPTEPLEWKFGDKPLGTHQPQTEYQGLPANFRPMLNNKPRKWGE